MLATAGCSKKAPEPISYEKAKVTQVEPEIFLKIDRNDGYSYVFGGILCDEDGNMYLSKNQELLKVTPDGKTTTFCSFKELPLTFNYVYDSPLIWGMTFDNMGNILAAAQDRIFKISKTGKIQTILMDDYDGFLGSTGIEYDNYGNLYITDGGRILKYSNKMEKTLFYDANEIGYTKFFGIKFSPDEKYLYATDFVTKTLIRFELDEAGNVKGTPKELIRLPEIDPNPYNYCSILNMVFSESGTMYASVDGMGKIMKMSPEGEFEFLDLGNINNHMITFGGTGFDEESLYITTMEGKEVYQLKVGEKSYNYKK